MCGTRLKGTVGVRNGTTGVVVLYQSISNYRKVASVRVDIDTQREATYKVGFDIALDYTAQSCKS